ncbi:jg8599, partial [Pararge aegeria aegeria]
SSRFIDNCCRRVKLRTSCLILTYLQLIGNLIKVIFAGIAISDGQEVVNANLDDDIKYRAKVAIILSGLTMTIVVICLLLIILLLVGLHK